VWTHWGRVANMMLARMELQTCLNAVGKVDVPATVSEHVTRRIVGTTLGNSVS
jgi:hypothetical protein